MSILFMSTSNLIHSNGTYFFKIYSNIVLPSTLGFPLGLFSVGLPVNILKAVLLSYILAICTVHLKLPDQMALNMLERYKI